MFVTRACAHQLMVARCNGCVCVIGESFRQGTAGVSLRQGVLR
jgi:hypothetical protein